MEKVRKKDWKTKVEIVKDSYHRSRNHASFAKHFYDHLFFLNPKTKDFFAKTDFDHQEKALMRGLDFFFQYFDGDENARRQMTRLAKVHSAEGLKIHPHYYYYWGEALILTIKQTDPKYYHDLEYYIREVISYPLSFFISQYFIK